MPRDWKGIALCVHAPVYYQLYSPVVVAGSNTHNTTMTAKKNSNKKHAQNHAFKGLREAFLAPGPRAAPGTSLFYVTADSNGNATFAQVLAPVGLTSATFSGTTYSQGTQGNIAGPPLRGLYGRAVDFQWYRVSRARLIFVSAVGATAVGQITLVGYSDAVDCSVATIQTYLSTGSTKTFDLASCAMREQSISVPVDSAWKKVSTMLSFPGNTPPFTAAGGSAAVNLSTVSDLSFGAVQVNVASAAPGTYLGTLHLEYDVEFKGPIDFSVNG